MKINKKSTSFLYNYKLIVIVVLLVATALIAGFIFYQSLQKQVYDPYNSINYDEATTEEREQANDNKAAAAERMRQDQEQPSSTTIQKTVKPSITFYGQDPTTRDFRAGAGIPEIYEEGGNCKLIITFTDGTNFTTERQSIKDANSTTCGSFLVPKDQIVPGKSSFIVEYESATAKGVSNQTEVTLR